jgi:hypothetical protein
MTDFCNLDPGCDRVPLPNLIVVVLRGVRVLQT